MVKKISIIMLIILTFFATFSMAFGASLRLDSMTTTPNIIKPGDTVDMTLRVQNIISQNENPKYSYVIEITPKNTLSENNLVIIDGKDNLGKLGANEYWNSKFRLKVKDGAPSATYGLNVLIYKYLDNSLINTIQTSVNFDVSGETFFKLDSASKTIQQGETKNFDVMLKNIGGANAGSVKLIFGNTADIQIVGTNTFYFSSLDNDNLKKFNVTLHAADSITSGTYNFPVTISYNDGTVVKTQIIEVGVIVGGNIDMRVASIETTPKEVRAGDNYVLVSLNLENAGFDDAKAISAKLDSNIFTSSYSDGNYQFVGRVDSGSFSNLKFYINIPKTVKSGNYNLNLSLNYKNLMDKNFSKILKVPFYIKEKPVLEIVKVQGEGKAGNAIKIKVNVKNIGEEDAQEVDMRLVKDSSLPFLIEERSVYIGNIKPNETKTAIFTVNIDKDAEINNYSVSAFLRARGDSEVGDNNIYTYNKDVNIAVTGKAINKLAVFGIGVAIIVLIGFVFNRKKKSKKIKKN